MKMKKGFNKINNKDYVYLKEHYARPWVNKVTHTQALKLSRKEKVPLTHVYQRAINLLLERNNMLRSKSR